METWGTPAGRVNGVTVCLIFLGNLVNFFEFPSFPRVFVFPGVRAFLVFLSILGSG